MLPFPTMTPIERAIEAAGSIRKLAAACDVSTQTVYLWKSGQVAITAERCVQLEELTGVPRADLRPDLYAKPKTNGKGKR